MHARPVAAGALMVLIMTSEVPLTLTGQATRAQIAAIDSLVRSEIAARRIPGVALAVVENGNVVLRRAYGLANLETGTTLDTNGVFELASVTKQFTAAAIMMLVEEGKVRLDDRLSAYVAGTPAAWEPITIRHLLTHTSGLDASALPRPQGSAPMRITTAQVFEFVTQQPPRFPPGATGWYSDAGYFLLGMVIEKASGQTYREFLQRRIFDPLNMAHSSTTDRQRVLAHRVSTYSLVKSEHVNWRRDWDYELPSFFGIWSTLDDVAAWDASLRHSTLLKPASLEQMWTPAKLDNGQYARVLGEQYGFGFELANLRGHRVVGHGGASGTYILRFVDEPLTVIVLTNLDIGAGWHHVFLARAIAGEWDHRYRPPASLSPRTDPDSETARTVQTLLNDVTVSRESAVMSDGYRSWYGSAPGARAVMRGQLAGWTAIEYLGRDDLQGKSLWGSEALDRLVHYSVRIKDRTTYLTVGLTKEGKVAKFDSYPR
jgi:D-alanyl-D-alanine carboxypeptidase